MFVFVYSPYQIKLLQNLQIVLDNQKIPNSIKPPPPPPPPPPRKKKKKTVRAKFSHPKNTGNQKFQTPKNPSSIPIA